MDLRQAPRFHAYFSYHEGRRVLKMSRRDWDELNRAIRPGELVRIEVLPPPIVAVMTDSLIEAVVAERLSESEVVIEVYRNDPKDEPTPINRDQYRVWERLPSHLNVAAMATAASTEYNANMRGYFDDYVFLVKDKTPQDHWFRELPDRVKAVLQAP